MFKKMLLVMVALAVTFVTVYHARPANAALIDKLVIKNDTTDAVVQYNIDGPMVGTSGCIRHRQSFSDGYVIKPTRVHIRVWKTMFQCPNNGHAVFNGSYSYWAPETTYTVTGSPHVANDIKVSTHH
jgi:hypothetical protein